MIRVALVRNWELPPIMECSNRGWLSCYEEYCNKMENHRRWPLVLLQLWDAQLQGNFAALSPCCERLRACSGLPQASTPLPYFQVQRWLGSSISLQLLIMTVMNQSRCPPRLFLAVASMVTVIVTAKHRRVRWDYQFSEGWNSGIAKWKRCIGQETGKSVTSMLSEHTTVSKCPCIHQTT